jgi:gamma-D-glutamyl-L-lysine dipeptidyl-peptidase
MLKFIVSSPVVDLKRETKFLSPDDYSHCELRETQLLFGEKLELLRRKDDWLFVAALEQPIFDEKRGWLPYTGWVHSSEVQEVEHYPSPQYAICTPTFSHHALTLSYGTLLNLPSSNSSQLRPISKIPDRRVIVEDAYHFVGLPYLWGGRAFPLGPMAASVDCSGLINLLYRAQGMLLPRNAHDQYLKCRPTSHLKPGDPLFLAKEKRINHVILKLDDKTFIESPQTGHYVRLLQWGTQFWEAEGRIHFFDREYTYLPYPCSFIIS